MTVADRARIVRRVAIGLQLVAFALVAIALYGIAWKLVTDLSDPARPAIAVEPLLYLPVLVGLLAAGVVGLRRWARGGSPTLLYGFDALPVFFLLFTAGPGALQDPLGLGLAAGFILPAIVTWAASAGGGRDPGRGRR